MSVYHIIVFGSVLLAAFAQMLLKKSAIRNHRSWIFEYLNPFVIAGYGMMLISMLIDIWAISKGVQVKEVSTIESSSYFFVSVLGWLFYKEKINLRKALAILLILAGVAVFFS